MVHGVFGIKESLTLAAPTAGCLPMAQSGPQVERPHFGRYRARSIYWLDQKETLEVGPTPQTVAFDLGGTYLRMGILQLTKSISFHESSVAQESHLCDRRRGLRRARATVTVSVPNL